MKEYYKMIQKELEVAPTSIKEASDMFFKACQRYMLYYNLNQKTKEAKSILKHYLDETDFLTQRKIKRDRTRQQSLDITYKLYIEFFWDMYHERYKEKKEKDFFDAIRDKENFEENIDCLWKEVFGDFDTENVSTKKIIKIAITEWVNNYDNATSIDALHLQNLRHAMYILERELRCPLPTLENSLTDVVTQEVLEEMLSFLEQKNYPAYLFTVAPMARALTMGEINSFTPLKDNTRIFFKQKFEDNLTVLKNYTQALQDLYDSYEETTNDILDNFNDFIWANIKC